MMLGLVDDHLSMMVFEEGGGQPSNTPQENAVVIYIRIKHARFVSPKHEIIRSFCQLMINIGI